MSKLGPLLDRNRAFAATGGHAGLALMPRQPVFLVTCLDPRVDPAAFLGVEPGDAPVIRNAGGRVTEAVIDPAATVRADVARLLASPKAPPQITVSGHVYDLQTGLVTIVEASQPEQAASPGGGSHR